MQNNQINRRSFIKNTGLALVALTSPNIAIAKKPKRPNILFIAVDDLRTQLGCYGHHETISPNIDKLASEGTIFNRAYCQVPVCGPSRVSILTSTRPNSSMWKTTDLKGKFITLPQHLKAQGYHTISNGKIFHHMNDSKDSWSESPWRCEEIYHGTDDWAKYNSYNLWHDKESAKHIHPKSKRGPYFDCADVPDNAYQDGQIADKTIADIKRLKQDDKPFFIGCGFWRPHLPFNAPKKYWDLYKREDIKVAENNYRPQDLPGQCRNSGEINNYGLVANRKSDVDFHREARHGYYACVSYIDAQVGRLLNELDRQGLADNTIVVLWGDHGWHLGEHDFWGKHNTLKNATHAPLIFKAPNHKKNNKTDALVEFIDMYPSICDLANIEIPAHVQGESFVPLLDKPDTPFKQAVYTQYGGAQSVKTDRYQYTRWLKNNKRAAHMLFDHQSDPQENTNIANDRAHGKLIKHLNDLLDNKR